MILGLIVLAVVGFVAYKIYKAKKAFTTGNVVAEVDTVAKQAVDAAVVQVKKDISG